MFKSIVAIMAVFASALFAHGANVSSVETKMGTLTTDDTSYTASALEYKASPSNSSAPFRTQEGWYAGLKLTWSGNSQNATSTKAKVVDNGGLNAIGEYTVYNSGDKTPSGSGMKNTTSQSGTVFNRKYWMSTTEWYIYVTPEFMYSLDGEDYSATLTIGGNTYTITVPQTVELSDGSHNWYPAVGLLGEKVYGDAQYLADQISVENYENVKFLSEPVGVTFGDGFAASDNGDGTWGVTMTHSHVWEFSVSAEGATLTATCGNAGCPVGGATTVSLVLSGEDKDYDSKAITASAGFDSSFKTIFPGAEATISITKDGTVVDTIKDVGAYDVSMVVTGVGDADYTLSCTVTISKVDISEAALVLTPATTTYNGKEQTVAPSVTVNNLSATIVVDTESSTTAATEMGTYSVTVNGTGNFEGTATATWSIVNTTGKGSTVAASAAGSMTASGTDFMLSDSSKLEYDAENEIWYAGITITWPKDKKDSWSSGGYAHYVKMDSVQVIVSDGSVSHATQSDKFRQNTLSGEKDFTYLSTTTWKVPLTPDIIAAALAEEKSELVYTMTAGAFIWGNDTEGDPDGVAFADYTITIPLDENLKLYDNYENQAYPAVGYVAQIGGKKYLSLADALEASESGQTVALIAQDDYDGEYGIPEGVTVALGEFGSADATYVLSLGSVLTSDAACVVSTSETGYGVERSGEGPYTYNIVMQHVHNWEVVVDDEHKNILTATCVAEACPLDTTTYSMRLFTGVKSGTTEDVDGKVYDGESMSRKAEFGDGFTDVFPNVETQISVTKGDESVDTIKDVGEYVVTMTVKGVGNDETVEYTLVKEVAISQLDIEGATVTLNPSSVTYDGKEHTVSCTIKKNNLTATFDFAEGSVTSATAIGEYTVKMNATGNFEGSATATWSIVNTTGSLKGVTSAVSGVGDFDSENNTLAVSDTAALEYSDNAWYAGITLEWPLDVKNYSGIGQYGHAYYITEDSIRVVAEEGEFENVSSNGSYKENALASSTKNFTYIASTTWKVAITPAVVEAALSEEKTSLEWTMNAGAIQSDTYANGVAFADYTITLPLDEPVEFVLGAGETYDLGDTVLTTTRIQLGAGASVTSSVAQAVADAIYTEVNGYDVVCSEDGGKYVYTALLTHVHDWTYSVDGVTLTATCGNAECPVEGSATTVSLNLSSGDKTYDNKAITASAGFDSSFKTIFPGAEATISITKDGTVVDTIKDVGAYDVSMVVTGVGDADYTLSCTVTISKVDISEAALVLTPATTTYNGKEQTVTPSVTVNNLSATIVVDAEISTTAATEMGTYSVTVNGTGNFEGTATATWSIVNTTGTPTSVAASAAGSMTASGTDFTLSDSSKLEYDAENEVWYAGIKITWPMEKKDFEKTSWSYYAHYVTEESVKATTEQGEITHAKAETSYEAWNGSYNLLGDMTDTKPFTYVASTTWKVAITPAIIEAALAEEKTSLTYTMNAGAFIWGDDTEGDPDGVAFTDYTITIPLEGIKLYDGDGKQVYPKTEGQAVIDEIKDDIQTTDPDDKEKVEAKVDRVAEIAGEGNEQAVADWVDKMVDIAGSTTAFFDALAKSEYVGASFDLGTETLITEESEVEVAEFESTDDGFTFAVKIDDGDIEAKRVKAASVIQTATSLDGESEFAPLNADRISFDGNKITITKDPNLDREFFKIVIEKDSK